METKEITINQEIIESLIINGDLSKLQPAQKVEYYQKYCVALGLNPVTQPFMLLTLNGKQKLYCGREGVAQLSKVHSVSHDVISTEFANGCYIVKAKAITGNRYTSSTGAVNVEGLKGEALCNALMKAEMTVAQVQGKSPLETYKVIQPFLEQEREDAMSQAQP